MIGRAFQRKTISGGHYLVDSGNVPWSLNQSAWLSAGGGKVSIDQAVGLPALLSVLLRIGQGVGMAPQKVYSGRATDREEAIGTWQYELLHDQPSSMMPPSTFRGNLAVQIAGAGYGLVRKWKGYTSSVVKELEVYDSAAWDPCVEKGQLVFKEKSRSDGMPRTLTLDDIIYVPGISTDGGPVGVSPLTAFRMALEVGKRRQAFEKYHYDNNAAPGTILSFPAELEQEQAMAWVDKWDEAHAGIENTSRTGAIGGGATVTTVPVSLVDAQFVEATEMTTAQAGAIYGMPKGFLNISDIALTDEDWRVLLTFCLGPYFTAIDQSFSADRDLFPKGSGMKAEHVSEALLRPDIRTRYEAYRAARQAGWLTSNEVRALENYPPHKDGDILQVIPVGGGQNPESNPTPTPKE